MVTAPEPLECRNIGTIQVIKPPSLSAEDIENQDLDIESDGEDKGDSISEINIERDLDPLERSSGFTQSPNDILPSHILADVFHEIDKVCRTISKKHTLCRKFATAFSDTLLVVVGHCICMAATSLILTLESILKLLILILIFKI